MNEDTDLACVQVVELVTAYLDGALDPDTTARVERHLAVCEPCRIYLDQFRRTIAELGRVEPESLSDAARRQLLEAFRALNSR